MNSHLQARRKFYLGDVLFDKATNSQPISQEELQQRANELGITIHELKAAISMFGSFHKNLQSKRIFQIGLGGIGGNLLDFYTKHFTFQPGHIVACDKDINVIRSLPSYPNIVYKHIHITQHNYRDVFAQHVHEGDMIVDLGYYVDTADVLQWCKEHGVLFINAAVEEWEDNESNGLQYPQNEVRTYTLYHRQMRIKDLSNGWNQTPTAILTIGANPGVVSYMYKIGLQHWVQHLVDTHSKWPKLQQAVQLIQRKPIDYPKLAQLMNIQVIQIAEKDTMRQSIPREQGEYIVTWSPMGFVEESIAPAELGWGTHETMTEKDGAYGYTQGPRNQVCFRTRGVDTMVQSFVPSGNFVGFIVRHEEAFSISDYLTVRDSFNQPVYRPTVYYAYSPCSDAIASVHEMKSNGWKTPTKLRLPKEELIDGRDELGCFMLSGDADVGNWWIGSIQSVAECREICNGPSPVTSLVTAGVFTGIMYAFNHPALGVIHPDHMNEDESMDLTLPYWYPLKSFHVPEWKPHVQSKFHVRGEAKNHVLQTPDWVIEKFLLN